MAAPLTEIVKLGASKQNEISKGVQWQAVNEISGEDDFEDFGEVDTYQGLGYHAAPWPADDRGNAEAPLLKNCGNRNGVCLPGRDLRVAGAVGTLRPGDISIVATDPQAAAQFQLKGTKRQVVCYTKDSEGTGMVIMLDGKNDKFQVLVRGAMIEIAPNGDMSLVNGGGASIMLQGSDIFLNGTVHLAGIPPGMALMAGPPSGSPGGPASVPMVPVMGVGK